MGRMCFFFYRSDLTDVQTLQYIQSHIVASLSHCLQVFNGLETKQNKCIYRIYTIVYIYRVYRREVVGKFLHSNFQPIIILFKTQRLNIQFRRYFLILHCFHSSKFGTASLNSLKGHKF